MQLDVDVSPSAFIWDIDEVKLERNICYIQKAMHIHKSPPCIPTGGVKKSVHLLIFLSHTVLYHLNMHLKTHNAICISKCIINNL